MSNSRNHCLKCFEDITPATDNVVAAAEHSIVMDRVHGRGSDFEAPQVAEKIGLDLDRVKAARSCAQTILAGECLFHNAEAI